jgi:dolichyl-phosphooligosaccharide-protein glycotransferase
MKKPQKDEEEASIDFSGIKKAITAFSKSKILITLILVLLIIAFTVFIRIQSAQLQVTDDWASNSVNSFYKNQITSQVNAQYPNLPVSNRDALINSQFDQFSKTNKDSLDAAIKQTSESFRSRLIYSKNNDKQTFLGDLDSYYWLRQSKNILNTGTPCDAIVNGTCMDTYILAPEGAKTSIFLHPYAIVVVYKIVSAVYPKGDMDLLLMRSSFLVPIIIACITSILVFFIARRIGGNLAGVIAALLLATSALLISRTAGSDTDIWNVFFPVLLVFLFFEAFNAKKEYMKYALLGLTGLAMGFFSFAWVGWWYMFDFLIASLLVYLGYIIFKASIEHKKFSKILHDKKVMQTLLFTVAFFILSGIFVIFVSGFDIFMLFVNGPFGFANIKDATTPTLWPNIFTTVAELNEANISVIVSQAGGWLLFMLALLGTVFWLVKNMKFTFKDGALFFFSAILFYYLSTNGVGLPPLIYFILLVIPIIIMLFMYMKNVDQDESAVKFSILLAIWFIGTMYASLKGVRFILLLIPIIAISAGIILAILYQKLKELIGDSLKLKGIVINIILIFLIFLVILQPVRSGYYAAKGFVPSISDGWVNSLQKIQQDSNKDAIINSWWDFGHWFKYWADRRVTLDGVTQNNPQAQWLGRMIQTSNEDESVGIMRMLDCGSNTAFDTINQKYQDTELSINLLKKIIVLDNKTDAERILLNNGFGKAEAEAILKLTHCTPPENYFITSSDMIGKAGVWAHFGLWNFQRSYLVENVKNKDQNSAIELMKSRYNFTDDQARKMYFDLQSLTTQPEINAWISAWPGYVASASNCVANNATDANKQVICRLNVQLGNNGQNVVVLESINATFKNGKLDNNSIKLGIAGYDPTSGARLGGNYVVPSLVYYNADGKGSLNTLTTDSKDFSSAVLIAKVHEDYVSVIADPTLVTSIFTQLYYLDGQYTTHFEKFHEESTVFGERIVVWKVKW